MQSGINLQIVLSNVSLMKAFYIVQRPIVVVVPCSFFCIDESEIWLSTADLLINSPARQETANRIKL